MQVSDFNLVMTGDDFARNNLYSVEIGMPNGLTAGAPGSTGTFGKFYNEADQSHLQKSLSYMAKTVSVPGKSIGTIDAKRFGPIYKVANDLIIDTVSMTFMLSEDWREHKFFDGWLSGIMGMVKKGTGSTVSNTGGNRQLYTLSYYNDYISTVNIIPLDRQGGRVTTVTLRNAYPTALSPVEMSWGNAGEVATFNVTWSFQDWNHEEVSDTWWADTSNLATGIEKEALLAAAAEHTREDYEPGRADLNAIHKANQEAESVKASSGHTREDYLTHRAEVAQEQKELSERPTNVFKVRPDYISHKSEVKKAQIETAQKEAEAASQMSGRHRGGPPR